MDINETLQVCYIFYNWTGLLDPKWIQERQRAMNEKKEQEEVYAPGVSIESSLKQLAERRTDIFGVGVEETQIGKKVCFQQFIFYYFSSCGTVYKFSHHCYDMTNRHDG